LTARGEAKRRFGVELFPRQMLRRDITVEPYGYRADDGNEENDK